MDGHRPRSWPTDPQGSTGDDEVGVGDEGGPGLGVVGDDEDEGWPRIGVVDGREIGGSSPDVDGESDGLTGGVEGLADGGSTH